MKRTAYPQKARDRIKAGMIRKRLQEFIEAKPSDDGYDDKVMTTAQVAAARILLSKVMPDLKQEEHTGTVEFKHTQELTRDELLHIAAAGRTRDSEKGRGSAEPDIVH